MTDRSNEWAQGWAFYQTGRGNVPDEDSPELSEWMKGFCAAMADYDLEGEYPSIQAALMDYGIDADLLAACLDAAERITQEPEFNRWPSVPVRGFGDGNLHDGPVVYVLPDAANDDG
ncbi:hypothetical protein Q9L42_005525 [Methylomarinum sp. Ch1-1]|uniref:CdiI immunity protein domain-containing protein n=1 Tax=Methylomarinum roseum TaxID=3067653 RepID=A0AAU7NX74_9GAMM|nr:hypothetical protein [Methylomarinum sp. Ch1-1]MDP4522338.1 hypothetical protein [Methylomarinum sp. Ch1-1]